MNKLYNAIMGLVVADAVGVPYEFRKRDSFHATDMIGHGTYNQPIGTWSDDSSLTLATLESIRFLGEIDLDDIMWNFVEWLYNHRFTPYNETFDVGHSTREAIAKYKNNRHIDPTECGGKNFEDNGNGSLMRILPLAFCEYSTEDVYNLSSLTHAHPLSKAACEFYLIVACRLLRGHDKFKAVDAACDKAMIKEFRRIRHIAEVDRTEIKSTGFVVDTLEAAMWCLLTTDSYRECVLRAVNLGGDTDTIAAVAGGLAGIYYGLDEEKGIPAEWIAKIPRKEYITMLCKR